MYKKIAFVFALIGLFILSCNKDAEQVSPKKTSSTSDQAKLNVYLTDAPGDYKAVYIDIEDIEIFNSDSMGGGWKSLDSIVPGIYNLMDLTNGADTILGSASLPAGKLNEIRLILGLDNFVVLKNNDSIRMRTPSAQQSGLKLKIKDSLTAGISYNLILDFDACKSVVKAGNSGKYNLKPVIRAFTEANSGAIKGKIVPDSVLTYVGAISGIDTFGTLTAANGEFFIRGLQAGSYNLYLEPDTSSIYKDSLLSGLSVSTGFVTDAGIIFLQ